MNPSPEGTVLRESRVVPVSKKIKIAVIILILPITFVAGWYGWSNYKTPVAVVPTEVVTETPQAELQGYIYLSGEMPGIGLDTYALNLSDNTLQEITTNGASWEFSQSDDSHALFATLSKEGKNQTEIIVTDFSNDSYLELKTPVGFYKRNIIPYTGVEDGVLYTARTTEATEDELYFDPQKWQIVIGTPRLQQFETLTEAFSPVYLSERNEILFLKEDGVYSYNLSNKKMYRIETGLTGFKADAEIAVSPDRTKMIVTAPIDNSIFIFDVSLAEVITTQKKGVIEILNRHFISPVISPDSRYYAVYGFQNTDEANDAQIEVRAFENGEPVQLFPIETFNYKSIRLNAWSESSILNAVHNDNQNESSDGTAAQ